MPPAPLEELARPFANGPLRGRTANWLAFQLGKTGGRLGRLAGGGKRQRPHRRLLTSILADVLARHRAPVCVETGCIRKADEGTDSTLAIAEALAGRGRFFSLELEPAHIAVCRQVCQAHSDAITFVQGDARAGLVDLVERGELAEIHFAFLDSADDPEQTLAEFQVVAPRFAPGALLLVDDVIRGVKGRRLLPLLARDPGFQTRLVFAGNGLLLARRS